MTLFQRLGVALRRLPGDGALDATAMPDARTLRDIGAPEAWVEAALRRRERDGLLCELERLRGRGVLGA